MTESVMASLEVPDVGNTVYGIQLRADSRNYHDNHDDHSLFLVVVSLTDRQTVLFLDVSGIGTIMLRIRRFPWSNDGKSGKLH